MKEKQEKRLNQAGEIEVQLLMQAYSRYVSRAHTIFETLFEIIFALISVTIGVVLSLIEVGVIPWNKYYLIWVIVIVASLIVVVVITASWKIFDSRRKRVAIVSEIKSYC